MAIRTSVLVAACLAFTSISARAQEAPALVDIVEAWLASPHADRTSEAFRHWDEEGEVPAQCATCHSGPGFLDFAGVDGSARGTVDHPAPIGSPVDCVVCHNRTASEMQDVTFPSGAVVAGLGSSAVCAVCHQGRASGPQLDTIVADQDDDAINPELGFVNVHYRAAAATLAGAEAQGGYQYAGKDYAGRFAHVPDLNTCADCHSPHSTKVREDSCAACHKGIESVVQIRTAPEDADGDGDTTEGVMMEIMTLHQKLYAAIQTYAAEASAAPIVHDDHTYPYFFNDTDGNGQVSEGEAAFPNKYASWTPRLLKAAYNYQFVAKDPGAFAHNPKYAKQLLIDSIEDLATQAGIDTAGLVRP